MNEHDRAAVTAGETTEAAVEEATARRAEGHAMAAWLAAQGITDLIPQDERICFGTDDGGLFVEYLAFDLDADGEVRVESAEQPVRWPNGDLRLANVPEPVLVQRRRRVTMLPPARVETVDTPRVGSLLRHGQPVDYRPRHPLPPGTFPVVDVPAEDVEPAVRADPPRP